MYFLSLFFKLHFNFSKFSFWVNSIWYRGVILPLRLRNLFCTGQSMGPICERYFFDLFEKYFYLLFSNQIHFNSFNHNCHHHHYSTCLNCWIDLNWLIWIEFVSWIEFIFWMMLSCLNFSYSGKFFLLIYFYCCPFLCEKCSVVIFRKDFIFIFAFIFMFLPVLILSYQVTTLIADFLAECS